MPNKEKFEEFEDYLILHVWCQGCHRQRTFKDETREDCYWSANMEGWESLEQLGEWFCPTCNEEINMDRQEIYDRQQTEYEQALLNIAENIDEEDEDEEDEDDEDEYEDDDDWGNDDFDEDEDDFDEDEDEDEDEIGLTEYDITGAGDQDSRSL